MSPLLSTPAAPTLTSPLAPPPMTPSPVLATPPVEEERPEPETRDFGDAKATRKAIFDRALAAASSLPVRDNGRHALQLENVHYQGPEDYSLAEQKAAILEGRSLGRKLRGTWRLKDMASGQDIDSRTATLATIPYLTPRGTFMNRGSEYSIINQFRLNPGIYTRRKENGEIEAHVNVMPGEGKAHRYFLDPEKGVFYARMGQAKIPLLPLLRAFGVQDKQLQESWGPELFSSNLQNDSPALINKYYERLLPAKLRGADESVKREALLDAFRKMRLNPESTRRTLGKEYASVDANTILDTTKKLLAVSRGEADVDDRDHLAYQTVVGPEDLIAERLSKDYGGLQRALFHKASMQGSLRSYSAGALNKQVLAALLHSGLGQNLEETNASEIFDKQFRITRMGEGGIPSLDSIPDEARAVQPSHLSMVDPLRTPECYDELTEVMTRQGWKPWPAVTEDDSLACFVNGQLEFHQPLRLIAEDYSGPMYGAKTKTLDYLVTPNHRMYVRRGNDTPIWQFEEAQHSFDKHCRIFLRAGHAAAAGVGEERGLPLVEKRTNNNANVDGNAIALDDWAEFVGWYLSEGSFVHVPEKNAYRVDICQDPEANPDNCKRIYDLLDRLPFNWNLASSKKAACIPTRQMAEWARQFGHCNDKFLPDYVFDWPESARHRLLEALLRGDGRVCVKGSRKGLATQYCSTSRQLAEDVHRLLFSLGIASRVVFEPDHREERYLGCYVVHIHQRQQLTLFRRSSWTGEDNHYVVKNYRGRVYCAEVPGGLLYVRRNNSVGFWCGNSLRAGVDVYLARAARKGADGKIYAPFQDARTGKTIHRSAQDVADLAVAFPKEMQREGKRAWALKDGKIRSVLKKDVDLIVPTFEDAFSPLANMIPFKSATKGQRVAMGSRMITQALPLTKGEAPLVQTGVPGQPGQSYESLYGDKLGAIRADQPARVMDVGPEGIRLRYADGREETKEIAHNFPYNRKTFFSQTPMVAAGDIVQPGQMLAKSNYVDDTGSAAMGLNARIAYMADGHNFEDAVSISQSFANKLQSEHMYSDRLDKSDDQKLGRSSYLGLFPSRFSRRQLDKIGDNGLVKPGTIVEPGDPLILAVQAVQPSHNRVHKKGSRSFNDGAVTWDHHVPGEVTDAVETDKGLAVFVKAVMPMQVGDKIANRYGGKGVVGKIYSDDQMPQDRDGKPLDILVSPTGVISRGNPAQVIETVLGKIAAKTGKPYRVADFEDIDDLTTFAEQELAKHGLSDLEDVIEPETQRKVPGILTGSQFFMKLQHTAEGKGQGRGTGGYTAEGSPAKGGGDGSKRIGLLTTNALLSHGATQVLRDASQIRGQRNEDFWLSFMQGNNPPEPDIPLVYKKFVSNLKASGINVVADGSTSHIMALTDKDVDEMTAGRELQNAETVNFDKNLRPVAGGLFDPALTGGHNGNRWSFIKLAEPMPNPVMEEPIRRMLGLTQNQFDGIIAGKTELPRFGGTGPGAIAKALSGMNVDRELEIARAEVAGSKKGARDAAIRRLGYLKSAQRLNIHPGDWMLSKAPVLPPIFRPISEMGDSKLPLVSDPNYLYRELMEANNNLKTMSKEVDDVGEERSAVYNAFKAVTGLADPLHPKLQEKQVKGILQHVFSSSPKLGMMQRRLLSTTVDTVGRGVITPDPDLDMDSVGIPESKAWDVYKNFVVRRLKRRGLSVLEAGRHVDSRSPTARQELLAEMADRPVFVDRAPVLHRFGVMAFWPRLTKDDTVHVSPLVVKGFGADFDGDTVNYHVPVSDGAKQEAMERMLPSRNLLSPTDFKTPMHAPGQDFVAGLYAATAKSKRKQHARRFMTKNDAIRAFLRGDASVDTEVEVDV